MADPEKVLALANAAIHLNNNSTRGHDCSLSVATPTTLLSRKQM